MLWRQELIVEVSPRSNDRFLDRFWIEKFAVPSVGMREISESGLRNPIDFINKSRKKTTVFGFEGLTGFGVRFGVGSIFFGGGEL